jgi:hypothetical protein
VRDLDTLWGEKEVARAAGILGSATVAAGFEFALPGRVTIKSVLAGVQK